MRIQCLIQTGVWGGSQIRGAKKFHFYTHRSGSPFLGQESGYFCWSNYAIFQGITNSKALHIINLGGFQKTGLVFFISYTYLRTLMVSQTVF